VDHDQKSLAILTLIADIRKFEIGLFWNRSLFFWGFTAIAITAFGGAYHFHSKELQFAIACAGFVCSFVWALVNRSSKYWQNTWEKKAKIASLEAAGRNLFAEFSRPSLCERIIKFPWWEAHFSVSKLATTFSDFTAVVWIGLGIKVSPLGLSLPSGYLIPLAGTIFFVIYIFIFCRPDEISN